MYSTEDINRILNKFIQLAGVEFPLRDCYLFGSYVNGNPNDYSDIDLAVVSDKFAGNRFLDREQLAKFVIQTSYDLEVHPFRTEDFTQDNPFVKEIIETGKKITLPQNCTIP